MARRRQYLERMKDVFFRYISKYNIISYDVDPPWRNVWRNQEGSTLPEHPDWGEWGVYWGEVCNLENYVSSFAYLRDGIVLAGTGYWGKQGIYRSTNFGLTWTKVWSNSAIDGVNALVNLGGGIVLAGTGWSKAMIYRSTDYGLTWTKVWSSAELDGIAALAYLGGSGLFIGKSGIVLAGGGRWIGAGIYRSDDYGLTWTKQWSDIAVIALANLGDGVVLAGDGQGDGIYRSTDYGLTWTKVWSSADGGAVNALVYLGGGGIVLAGTEWDAGIYRSTDYGLTWTNVWSSADIGAILALVYLGSGIALAGGAYDVGKIYRSVHHHV